MNIEQVHEFVLSLQGTEESMPFGDDAIVFKVGGKMFMLIGLKHPLRLTVKCEPSLGAQLIEEYPDEIQPGYHMNKKHWLTINLDGNLSLDFLKERILHSRTLVIEKLPQKVKADFLPNSSN